MPEPVRLNKFIADSGYCARRKADALIAAGRVRVNGVVVDTLGSRVDPQTDRVTVDDQPITTTGRRFYVAFHKPAGVLTARRAGKNQKTLYDLLPERYRSGDPAGRLDKDTSGLLILSNDGDFLHRITHPRYHLPKRYAVQLNRTLGAADKKRLKAGIQLLPENKTAVMQAVQALDAPNWYEVTLITGYNRQIRRSFEALGFQVKSLQRVAFGPVRLDGLKSGGIRPLTPAELDALTQDPAAEPEQGQHGPQDQNRKPQHRAQRQGQDQAEQEGEGQGAPSGRTRRGKRRPLP